MPKREFTRLTDRLLHRLGEEAVLRGVTEVYAQIEHGVDFADVNDQAIFNRSVVTLNKTNGPFTRNDSVEFLSDGSYFVLDALIKDNGYSQQWSVIGKPKPELYASQYADNYS